MGETIYMISQASRLVQADSHMLRYWEDKLALPVARNDRGQRYYTVQDIQVFKSIAELREKGFQLDTIKRLLPMLFDHLEDKGSNTSVSPTDDISSRTSRAWSEVLRLSSFAAIMPVDFEKTMEQKVEVPKKRRYEALEALEAFEAMEAMNEELNPVPKTNEPQSTLHNTVKQEKRRWFSRR